MPRLTSLARLVTIATLASQVTGCVHVSRGRIHSHAHAHLRGRGAAVMLPLAAIALAVSASVHAAPPPSSVWEPLPAPPPPPPAAYAPAPGFSAPPVVVVAPAPPPPPPVPAPMVQAHPPPPPPRRESPAHLAIKYAPGTSGAVGWGSGVTGLGFTQSIGVEVRPASWLALRSDFELRPEGRSWDMVGVKVTPFPSWGLKPYASASLAASEAYAALGKYQLGVSVAAGADVFLGRHFFLEAEARYRVSPGAGACCREVPRLIFLVGAGVAFL